MSVPYDGIRTKKRWTIFQQEDRVESLPPPSGHSSKLTTDKRASVACSSLSRMSTFGSRFGIWENVSGYSYWGSCCVFILIVYLQLLLHFQFKLLTFLSQFHTLPTDRTAVGCLKPVWETNQATNQGSQCTNVKYTPATPSSFISNMDSQIQPWHLT